MSPMESVWLQLEHGRSGHSSQNGHPGRGGKEGDEIYLISSITHPSLNNTVAAVKMNSSHN